MKLSTLYQPTSDEIDRLVASHPLALLFSGPPDRLAATPLPLLLERRADGTAELRGHFARANPQTAAIAECPRALAVFQGPGGYISPSWFRDRTQAPTWNYSVVQFVVDVELLQAPEAARAAVEELTAVMEQGRPRAWRPRELGPRHDRLLAAIVPFRARVVETRAKFKLGQNERTDVLEDIVRGLEANGDGSLAARMRAANPGRL
jgi:transcriptional regulator